MPHAQSIMRKFSSCFFAAVLACSLFPTVPASADEPQAVNPGAQSEAAVSTDTGHEEGSPGQADEAGSASGDAIGEGTVPGGDVTGEGIGSADASDPSSSPAQTDPQAIVKFVGATDESTPLQSIEVAEDEKTTADDLSFPATISVILQSAVDAATEGQEPAAFDLPVTWTCADDYANTSYELYTFTPVLPEGYTLAEGVTLPFIEVKVGEANDNARFTAEVVTESAWIKSVNNYTTYSAAASTAVQVRQTEQFYNAVPFAADGTGQLNWVSSRLSGQQVWNGTDTTVTPTTDANDDPVYSCNTPGELLFALRAVAADTSTTNKYTIKITQDMDFNGAGSGDGKSGMLWPQGIVIHADLTLDGKKADGTPATLYNLYMCADQAGSTVRTGFISQADTLHASNLNFQGANIQGKGQTGGNHPGGTGVLLGAPGNPASGLGLTLDNISLSQCVVTGNGEDAGSLIGSFNSSGAAAGDNFIDNCNVSGCVVLGNAHVGALSGPLNLDGSATYNRYIDRCYAVDAVVVSYGGHSGGLISCMSGSYYGVSNCFVDAQVYGEKTTGVFTGCSTNVDIGITFSNCFTSGFVEGTSGIGGFIGGIGSQNSQLRFLDCYSTALVGLSNGGTTMGGFMGNGACGTLFANCYAAGEVGSADTISSGALVGGEQASTIGGFVGSTRANNASFYTYCYYDKQTTGMREYDCGMTGYTMKYNTALSASGALPYNISKGDQGLRGVLTTSTAKAGRGLVESVSTTEDTAELDVKDAAGSNYKIQTGFTGFRDNRPTIESMATAKGVPLAAFTRFAVNADKGYGDTDSCWDTSSADHYPELRAFKNNLAGFVGDDIAIAKAYSASSTSTIMLETWKTGLDTSTGQTSEQGAALPATTYDTVRDLTLRFNATSDSVVDNWMPTKTQDGLVYGHATVAIKGDTKNVLALQEEGSSWYADKFVPGLEWLKVNVTVEGASASRRLRVTPTAGIEAGDAANIYQTVGGPAELYDHADDVQFFYSTAARLAEEPTNTNITTGVYPDTNSDGESYPTGTPNNITDGQKIFGNADGGGPSDGTLFNSTFGGKTNDRFGYESATSAPGVDMSYMARAYEQGIGTTTLEENSAKGSKVYTYVRVINGFDMNTGHVNTSDKPLTMDINTTEGLTNANRFNGYAAFQSENTQYLIEYVWEFADGRIVNDAKILTVKALPFTATITAYEAGGINTAIDAKGNVINDETLRDANSTTAGNGAGSDVLLGIEKNVTSVNNASGITIDDGSTTTSAKWSDFTSQSTPVYEAASPQSVNTDPSYASRVVASWKRTNALKTTTKLKIEFVFDPTGGNNEAQKQYYSATIDNPEEQVFDATTQTWDYQSITIPYTYWRIVTLSDGKYYSVPQTLSRVYKVGCSDDGVFYLYFDKQNEKDPNGLSPELEMTDAEDNINVSLELSEALVVHKDTAGTTTGTSLDTADLTKQFSYKLYFNDKKTLVDGIPDPGTYAYRIWDDSGTPDDYSDDVLAPTTVAGGTTRPNSGIFLSGTDLTTAVQPTSTDGTPQAISLCDGEYISILGAEPGMSYRLVEADYSSAKYTPANEVKEGWLSAADTIPPLAWTSIGSGAPVTSGVDTGEQTMPTAYVNGLDNTLSRVQYTNTYKEVPPTGIHTDTDWPWWLVLVALALAAGATALGVHSYRRRQRVMKFSYAGGMHSRQGEGMQKSFLQEQYPFGRHHGTGSR